MPNNLTVIIDTGVPAEEDVPEVAEKGDDLPVPDVVGTVGKVVTTVLGTVWDVIKPSSDDAEPGQ